MKKFALMIMLCLPMLAGAQTIETDAKQKAEQAQKAAEEAARKAEEARIAALKAEAAAKEAAAAKAKAEAEAAKAAAEQAEKALSAPVKTSVSEPANPPKANVPATPSVTKWEAKTSANPHADAINPDAKYLEGAVPEVDGQVEWTLSLDVPGRNADWIYNKLGQLFTDLTHEEGQKELSRVALADEQKHTLGARFQEWLVFKSSALSLDRTEFNYTLIAKCLDGHADVTLGRINYKYEADRNGGQTYKAEQWISDKYGLNKQKTKLAKLSGKFRRKTIDRKDQLFKEIKNTLLLSE